MHPRKQGRCYQSKNTVCSKLIVGAALTLTTLTELCIADAGDPCELPAWTGALIDGYEAADHCYVETHGGSSGSLYVVEGFVGQAVRLDYQLGTAPDSYVQVRCEFDPPFDLSGYGLFGISLHGSATPSGESNRVRLMVADVGNVFYGFTIGDIGHLDRWLINMPVAKHAFTHQSWSAPPPLEWALIDRVFVVIEPPTAGPRILTGDLTFDHLQAGDSHEWPCPDQFTPVASDAEAAALAVECVYDLQCSTGLFQSWQQEPEPKAWLYDQALALLMSIREGRWAEAESLVAFLLSMQKADGHWASGWNCSTGGELADDRWVGDQAWMAYALHQYGVLRPSPGAVEAARRTGGWLAERMEPDGKVVTRPSGEYSTEGNFDTWMAFMELGRIDEADLIAGHLLTTFWDPDLGYWLRGLDDPVVALNANTWLAKGFALHPRIDQPDMARRALCFVRRTLATQSDDGQACGLDFEGPVSVHCEGIASYAVAQGTDSQQYLDILLTLQRPDGCLPGSTDDWRTDAWWLTSWSGVAPTAWSYFALTGSPFDIAPLLYVDAGATGPNHDGSSWCNAYIHLQDALATAGPSTEIRVAHGTYYPDRDSDHPNGTGNRQATFDLIDGVTIAGGYAGCGAPDPDERDIEAHETILSGDLNGDDGPARVEEFARCFSGTDHSPTAECGAFDLDEDGDVDGDDFGVFTDANDYADNSYHVVTASGTEASATLDGFTIAAGNANGDHPDYDGGGIYSWNGSPTLIACRFVGNAAFDSGGAMLNEYGGPSLTDCTFVANFARWRGGGIFNAESGHPTLSSCMFNDNSAYTGGGMHNRTASPTLNNCDFSANTAEDGGGTSNWQSHPTLTNCTFTENTAKVGAGMGNWQSSPTLIACTFQRNSASFGGGGVFNEASNPHLTNCLFDNNTANQGGGVHNRDGASPILQECTFVENLADNSGGGLFGWGETNTSVANCIFSGNSADFGGGGSIGNGSTLTLGDCTFSGNIATWDGGGMVTDDSRATLINCIFDSNLAYAGGGLHSRNSTVTLTNHTFVGNAATEGNAVTCDSPGQRYPSIVQIMNCILWDGGVEVTNRDGSTIAITHSNVLVEEGVWPGDGNINEDPGFADADLHLLATSPCINAGSNYAPELPVEDLDGNLRIDCCRVDMGTYESPFCPPLDDCNANGEDDGCDVYNHDSKDANRNHIPDECEPDCNENGFPDFLDLLFGSSEDCNFNEVPDECESDEDCNNNGIQDICDVAGWDGAAVFATGIAGPEDIVVSQGDYPNGYLVTGLSDRVVYHVSPLGGSVTEFAAHLSWPVGARMLPPQFSGHGNVLAVADGAGIALVGTSGSVHAHTQLPLQHAAGLEYVPLGIGGPAAGKLVVTGYDLRERGRVFTVDNACVAEAVAELPSRLWTPTLAPHDFGAFGDHIFVGEVMGRAIYALDLETSEFVRFAEAPFHEHLRGLRQIAFSPLGWGSALDPTLGDDRLLLISVAHRILPEDAAGEGAIMAWDPEGRLVAIMRAGPDGQSIEPRGLTFVANDLLISDMTQGRDALLLATIDDFRLLDCNHNGVPDRCEIESCPPDDPHCRDCNVNGVPDGCERDCDENGIPDECDVESSTSKDCNENWWPDECEEGGTEDCNGNSVSDLCDVFSGNNADCNSNGVPDKCDIAAGTSDDCQPNDIPDECEEDCNGNGRPDECDIADCPAEVAACQDCNSNGISDECDVDAFGSASSWLAYAPAHHGMCNSPGGYYGAAFDGRYVYFAPFFDGGRYHGSVLRYDTQDSFDELGSWDRFDAVNSEFLTARGGYTGAVFDGRYVYFVPYLDNDDWHGEVLRYDTLAAFESPSSWATFDYGESAACIFDPNCNDPDGYVDGVFDGRYVYFVPTYNGSESHGEVLRYDSSRDFDSAEAWTTFDPGEHGIGSGIDGWHGAVFDGQYVYFAPAHTGSDWHGEVLRYDAQEDFVSTSSWSACDPGEVGVGNDPDGYYGGVFDGRYVYFVPYHNGTDWHGEVLRLDTWQDVAWDFCDPSFWSAFDPGENGVGDDADGYIRGVFDGRYVYFVPLSNGTEPHAEALRYDTTATFEDPSSWATYDYGEDPMGCARQSTCSDPDGFAGAVYDGEFIYFVPHHNGSWYHGEVLRYDTRANASADCNQTVVPDECESIDSDDFDADENVGLFDFEAFVDCMEGPAKGPAPFLEGCEGACLKAFDMDTDLDIDLVDFGTFQRAFQGPP